MDITRIVSHTDFDGLISALLLQEVLGVEEVAFTEPWLISDSSFVVHKTDAVVDLPYPPGGCGLWIDHHESNNGPREYFDATKKSCPSLIYEKFKVSSKYLPLIAAADKIDSASYTEHDLRHPDAAMQISISLDKTQHYHEFLIEQLRDHSLEYVAKLNLVQERYRKHVHELEQFLVQVQNDIVMRGNVLYLDATGKQVPQMVQFLLYLEYPQTSVALFIIGTGDRLRVNVSENIFNRINTVNIGQLMRQYGGGGHKGAGGCTIPAAQQEEIIDRLVATFNQN